MKNNPIKLTASACLICATCLSTHSQGTFQNLNFESANLPIVPAGQSGGFVSSLDAIPYWTACFSTIQTTQIWHNNVSLGAVNISILGPNFSNVQILAGNYSVVLQSGLLADAMTRASATIAQTGTIPATAMSLQLLAQQVFFGDPTQLLVSIGGQNVALVALSTTANYTIYGADISSFSGQTKELRISSLPTADSPYNSFLIDSISFSNQPIPEPSAFGLFGLGAVLLGSRLRKSTRM